MQYEIRLAELDDERIARVLQTHSERARAETAPGSAHALDLGAFRDPLVETWSAWRGQNVLGVGAWKPLTAEHAELKSFFTIEKERGQGVASTLLDQIMESARAAGISKISLETGSWPYFRPARAFYLRRGFVECPPFGDYLPDPNSIFMTRKL